MLITLIFFQAIVFIVGGGNYIEYANLRNFQNVCRAIASALYHFLNVETF